MDIKYIAVSNANGWGRGNTPEEARKYAVRNSLSSYRKSNALRVTVYPCQPDAYVDGLGTAHGVTADGTEYRRLGATKWASVRLVEIS